MTITTNQKLFADVTNYLQKTEFYTDNTRWGISARDNYEVDVLLERDGQVYAIASAYEGPSGQIIIETGKGGRYKCKKIYSYTHDMVEVMDMLADGWNLVGMQYITHGATWHQVYDHMTDRTGELSKPDPKGLEKYLTYLKDNNITYSDVNCHYPCCVTLPNIYELCSNA